MVNIIFDILEPIFRNLAQVDRDHQSLRACSLTCKTFLSISRRYIFSSIDFLDSRNLAPDERDRLTRCFNQLIDRTPEIASYVRFLKYMVEESDFDDAEIHRLLERTTNVKLFFLCPRPSELAWSAMPAPFASIIGNLIHLPTLTHLTMMYFTELPILALAMAAQLEHLTLTDVEFLGPSRGAGVPFHSRSSAHSHERRPRLKALEIGHKKTEFLRMILEPIAPSMPLLFDMAKMEIFKVQSGSLKDMETVGRVCALAGEALKSLQVIVRQNQLHALDLTSIPCLRDLNIQIGALYPEEMALAGSLTHAQTASANTFILTPAANLRTFKVWASHSDREEYFLHGIADTLSVSWQSPFQHMSAFCLVIGFDAEGSYLPCWESTAWPAFDSVLTNSGFPSLRKVTIESRTSFDAILENLGNPDEQYRLKMGHFPRLTASKTLYFDFNSLVWNTTKGRYV